MGSKWEDGSSDGKQSVPPMNTHTDQCGIINVLMDFWGLGILGVGDLGISDIWELGLQSPGKVIFRRKKFLA